MKKILFVFSLFIGLGVSAQNLEQSATIDFGPTGGTNGAVTASPDSNGNYWNNATSGTLGTSISLVNTLNAASGFTMEVTDSFIVNNSVNYGPTTTDASQLGDLSIQSATQDYFYLETSASGNNTGQLTFSGLDVNNAYKFYVFASRPTGSTRITNYIFTGDEIFNATVQTSDGGSGNLDNVLETQLLLPNASGEITIGLSIAQGGFGYINTLKFEEYSNVTFVDVASISVAGNDINQTGQTSQMTAEVLPANATDPSVIWSVDDESIAVINSNGLLAPVSNGTVTVKATSVDNPSIFGDLTITVSNQTTELYFSGTATENGDNVSTAIPMKMVTGVDNAVTPIFEIYTSLNETGNFSFYTSQDGSAQIYGAGSSTGELQINGAGIDASESGPVLITVNLDDNTYSILPINWSVVGSSIPNSWSGDEPLTYQGDGIWSATIDMTTVNSDTNPRFIFKGNQNWSYVIKKIAGTQSVVSESQGNQFGILLQDIDLNYGTFLITLNLSDYTYSVECDDIDDYKVSFMGSSVARGVGATNQEGYAYQYDVLLSQRASNGSSPFYRSNISVSGNNTVAVLNRYEKDLIGDCGTYVVYGLSLGNEGVHENGQSAFDQFETNLQILIQKAIDDGRVPVIMNNYTRGDYNASDYNFIKQMNLLIGQWDLPSVNLLGAVDNGTGNWATGYEDDYLHPNDAGHTEFFYAMVPSLFDALEANKPQPVFTDATEISLSPSSINSLAFTPENIVHPFTVSLDFKTNNNGQIIAYSTDNTSNGTVGIDANGYLKYTSPTGATITDNITVNDNTWHNVTLTHYYARGETFLYRDANLVGSYAEQLETDTFNVHGSSSPANVSYKNWLFYRSGMTSEEITTVHNGTLLKSSLELYAPLDEAGVLGDDPYANLAQSTNTVDATNFTLGAMDIDKRNLIQIHPNPVKNVLNINTAENIKEVNVYSLTGVLLNTINSNKQISFKDYTTGLYVVKVETSLGSQTFKIIKE
ncbi:Ig-like domain-containing protein [Psychroserpens sp. Hel_I_66]|uniref:Ig-like domain-containing protein n=1 Tax=Psychroserpens sp. Hel_I_66 TaxID=1250004 RepID=UPI00068997DE|nr:Ig-like domain-containing protein [Psychroserpens sp. Hel_I_66]